MSERATACPGLNALAAFLDGRLAAGDKAAVQEHIATCDVCLDLVAETLLVPAPVLVARRVGIAASGAPRSWSRSRWAAVAAAVAAVLIAALLAPGLGSLPNVGQGPKLADLAEAAGLGRPVEGRLTGGFTHRPWFAPLAGGQGGAMTSSTAIQLAAGKIRGNLQADSTATRLHAYGVSQVLLRDWAQASLALAAAAREQPRNARYQSDVAALYLERVRNGERPGDLIKALAAAERARLADPRLPEAWFNRALALEQLSLRGQARAAWADYLARDHSSAWADEARSHLAALDVPVAASSWPSVEARLRAGVDMALAEEAIRVQASETRTFFEAVLWPAWAAAVLADRPADVEREALRTMADAFLRLTGDTLYRDAVAAIDRAGRRGPAAGRALAEAHAAYAEAAQLARQDLFSAAVPKLTAARAQLDAAGSPFAVRAAQDLAGAQYYNRKLADASDMAARVLEVSRAAGYCNLESRATWLQGLVAFAEGRYGDARAAWEQMLASAEQGADVEQQAAAHGLLANLLDYLGDSDPAWQHRRVALAAMEASGATRLRYGLLLSTAGQALKEHDPAAALALQDAVVETAMQSKRPAAIAEALAARASIHAALGLIQKATDDLAATRSEILAMPDAALRARIEGTVLVADVNLLKATNSSRVTAAADRAIRWFDDRKETARLPPLYLALGEAWLGRGEFAKARRAASTGISIFEREQAARPATAGTRTDEGWQLYEVGLRAALGEGDLVRGVRLRRSGPVTRAPFGRPCSRRSGNPAGKSRRNRRGSGAEPVAGRTGRLGGHPPRRPSSRPAHLAGRRGAHGVAAGRRDHHVRVRAAGRRGAVSRDRAPGGVEPGPCLAGDGGTRRAILRGVVRRLVESRAPPVLGRGRADRGEWPARRGGQPRRARRPIGRRGRRGLRHRRRGRGGVAPGARSGRHPVAGAGGVEQSPAATLACRPGRFAGAPVFGDVARPGFDGAAARAWRRAAECRCGRTAGVRRRQLRRGQRVPRGWHASRRVSHQHRDAGRHAGRQAPPAAGERSVNGQRRGVVPARGDSDQWPPVG